MEKNIQYLLAILVIAVVLGGVGYISWKSTTDDSSDVIKLGATVSESGKYTTEGTRVKNGYVLAVDEINARGGIEVAGKKHKIELITYDDGSDKATAAQLYDQLITEDKVDVLLGPYSSSIVLSVAPVAEQYKIPFIQAGGASDSIYKQDFEYTFGLYRVGSTYTQPFFQWLNTSGKVADVSTVALFLEDSSFPNSVWSGAEKFIANAGLTVKKEVKYTSGDLDSIATNMQALKADGGADIILTIGHYADANKVVDEIAVNGLTPKAIFGTVGVPEPKFAAELGSKAENVLGFAQWVTNIPEAAAPGITAFLKNYEDKYGEVPAYHAAGGYSAIYVVEAAIKKAGTYTDGDAIKNALQTLSVDTVWGKVEFTSTGVIGGPAYMVQIQDGKIETCYPGAYETAPVIFPRP